MLPIWCKDNEGKWVRIPYEILQKFDDGSVGIYLYAKDVTIPLYSTQREFFYRCRNSFTIGQHDDRAVLMTTEEQEQLKLKEQELVEGNPR